MSTALRRRLLSLSILSLMIACSAERDPVAPLPPSFKTGDPSPSGVTVVAASESRIDVSWQDNAMNETGFEVHRSTTGAAGRFTLRASTAASVAAHSDVGLTPSTECCYKIRAFQTAGRKTSYSAFSNTACATTPAPPPPPGPPNAPTFLDALPANSSVIVIQWRDNSANEAGFRVERSTDGGASWVAGGTVGENGGQFFDTDRPSEQQICYRVHAFSGDGDSPPSNTDCTAPPTGPPSLSWSAGELTWPDNSLVEDGYEVWMLDAAGVAYEGLIASLPANSTSLFVGDCSPVWCWGFAVVATKDGGYSDWAQIVTRSP